MPGNQMMPILRTRCARSGSENDRVMCDLLAPSSLESMMRFSLQLSCFRHHYLSNIITVSYSDAADAAEILRQHSAMRSFTESVDADLPPAPELPQSLDIDYQYPKTMTESDTGDTIVEVLKKSPPPKTGSSDYDKTLGASQKYPMVVPGPGHVDAEQELHESLLPKEEESSESDFEVRELSNNHTVPKSGQPKKARTMDADHDALRREYSVSAVQRPRPTTPTSWCAIENYVEESSTTSTRNRNVPPDAGAKMLSRRRKSSMSWSDFYESMATQIPPQARSASVSGRGSPMNTYDGDILEEDPRYKKMAPPKPVIHRRSSTDWENFEENSKCLHIFPHYKI
ncbi:unnamed protein product [Toxocara canis]|uniref:GRB2-associated-binding protein 2 n=1 Tax=Toxocara canis TaxID=6265 RepID=A0A183UY25_TOXCA|nr:unnamed protein product [Toxocara canis]